jgi:NADPH-dependent ferric siderophore reductase
VAGEAADVLTIRAFLVKWRGLDRRSLNLMGYWRRGQSLS